MFEPKIQKNKLPNIHLLKYLYSSVVAFTVVFWLSHATAAPPPSLESLQVSQNTQWVLLTGCLVFFMNAGFAMLESGFCRSANAINVLAKNLIVFAIATLAFWTLGYGFMFGDGSDFIGWNGFFLQGVDNSPLTNNSYQGVFHSLKWAAIPLPAKFFFQLTFAGTTATIVSGAVAERIKFGAFIGFSFFLVLSYSITGHWIWGSAGDLNLPGGVLYNLGFRDFAGSTVVHSVGGWAALVGTFLLKPRLGKYRKFKPGEKRSPKETSFSGKKIISMPAHNLSTGTLGCFILWLGWFGFNAGSTLTANSEAIAHILLVTLIAGAMAGISATFWAWQFYEKPSLAFMINGILAGCVSITASCAFVNITSAALIGVVGGVLVVWATIILDKSQIDDPVGAIPVHLVCGVWGTLAVGLFSQNPNSYPWSQDLFNLDQGGLVFSGSPNLLFAQLIGILLVGIFTIVFSAIAWIAISYFMYIISETPRSEFKVYKYLRVLPQEEVIGIDSLFADNDHSIDQLKRDYLKRQQEKRSRLKR
ncbi:ammonium transporter [Sphaerospermopsis aphanizomenoides]|uniref:ammonium transporter n=1 Tax=Sphaerospermopsis aphanizomenoides TaxID=459663 RepID=UPI001F178EED|nr:ammonium transporter [Sphaerospermopsis aphanizomenoides]